MLQIIAGPLIVLTALVLASRPVYEKSVWAVLFLVLLTAPVALRELLIGGIPVIEILFFAVPLAYWAGGYNCRTQFSRIPTKSWLWAVFICMAITTIRGTIDADGSVSRAIWRVFPAMFTLPLLLSTKSPERSIRYCFLLLCAASLVISVIHVGIFLTDTVIVGMKGHALRVSGRIVWGGFGSFMALTLIMSLVCRRFFGPSGKRWLAAVGVLAVLAMLLAQTRHMIMLSTGLGALWLIRGSKARLSSKIAAVSAFVLLFLFLALTVDHPVINAVADRFAQLDKEVSVATKLRHLDSEFESVGRWSPLMKSIRGASTTSEWLFGKGANVRGYNGQLHVHSGWGWILQSMGLIGCFAVLGLIIATFLHYWPRGAAANRDDIYTTLTRLILLFLMLKGAMGLTLGFLLQGWHPVTNGFCLGMLELIRRAQLERSQISLPKNQPV